MALADPTKLYAVSDAKIAKLLTDPSGGSATYDSLIDVPGIKSVGLDFEFNDVELRGDNGRMESDSTLIGVNVSFDHAKVSFDALAVMLGGTVTNTGTTPDQVKQFRRLSTDVTNYFKFEAKTPTGGVDTTTGDAHLVIYKLRLTGYDLGFAEEDYQTFSGEARGVARVADSFLFDLVHNETAAAIA